MDNKPLTELDLAQFTGSETLYKHLFGMLYTEGVQYLAEKGKCYWLIDAIQSYQRDARLKDPDLRSFQLWELERGEGERDFGAVLTCRRDSGEEPIITQVIEYTDFPLKKIKLYVCDGTLLLPSEY